MKFTFHYPETVGAEGDLLDSGPPGEVARAAELAGFDALTLTEHPIGGANWLEAGGGHQSLDPFVGLAFVAAATSRLRLLTHVAVAPYRNPFLLAKAAATLDRLSGGRLILGLGVGYQKSEFYALGVNMDERGRLIDEALDCLPLHWSGEPFSYKGLHFDARNVRALPRPAQDPIPIWIGGNSMAARRRAAERGQGWMPIMGGSAETSKTIQTPLLASFDDVAVAIRDVTRMAEEAGRTEPLDFLCSYGDESIDKPTAEPERHRDAFARMEQAGLTSVIIATPPGDPAAVLDFLEAFGETYIV